MTLIKGWNPFLRHVLYCTHGRISIVHFPVLSVPWIRRSMTRTMTWNGFNWTYILPPRISQILNAMRIHIQSLLLRHSHVLEVEHPLGQKKSCAIGCLFIFSWQNSASSLVSSLLQRKDMIPPLISSNTETCVWLGNVMIFIWFLYLKKNRQLFSCVFIRWTRYRTRLVPV